MNHIIPNSTQIPNIVIDFIIPSIPEAESKCLLYICRRTFGFRKDREKITFNQFISGTKSKDGANLDHGTGLSRDAVSKALFNLEEAEAILVKRKGAGRGKQCIYEINLDMEPEKIVETIQKNRLKKLHKPRQTKLFKNCGKAVQKMVINNDQKINGHYNRPLKVINNDQYQSFKMTNNHFTYNVPVKKQRETKGNKELADAKNKNCESLGDILKNYSLKTQTSKNQKWQDLASEIVEYIRDGEIKRSSIFKCCKDNYQWALKAFNDCKELEKPHALYFLKVFNELAKR